MSENTTPLLRVVDLSVAVDEVSLVDGVRFDVAAGEIMALVGESGCGKSMTALALMRLLPSGVSIVDGEVFLAGRNLTQLSEVQMEAIRGNDISMIFQEPVAALNPLMTVGDQVVESLRAHQGLQRREAMERALDMFEMVGIADPRDRMRQYPFELSGGMCQRVMIASALICGPSVLIADEPTTALDVTIQAQILKLIKEMCAERQTGVVLITHDIGVVADTADRV
ncbi:MAG: ABC transporter ATP-binding protein, partial [Alphaproteobacteria bacterium]